VRPPHPLAQRLIRGNALGLVARLLQAGEHLGREGDGFAWRDIGGQQGVQTSSGVAGQPAPDGVPRHAQQARHLLALVGLSTRQPVAPLQARRLMTVRCTAETLFAMGRRFRNQGPRLAHGVPST
jgi:hypothetical protein